MNVHIGAVGRQRLVEVIHLRENADYDHNRKDVCGRVGELIVAAEGELERNAKAFDRHDRYGSYCRADADVHHGVLLPVYGRNLVYHDQREYQHDRAVRQETCERTWVVSTSISWTRPYIALSLSHSLPLREAQRTQLHGIM